MSRYHAWQSFAALLAIPLIMALASVFDPGVLGQLVRAAIQLAV